MNATSDGPVDGTKGDGWETVLFRAALNPPPIAPPSSWSDNYGAAEGRRAQLVVGGFRPIFRAEVAIDPARVLDCRTDSQPLRQALGADWNAESRVRDLVHENEAALASAGWVWVVFGEDGEPGLEYVHLQGGAIDAVQADIEGNPLH